MAAWDNDPVLSRATGNAWDSDPVLNSPSTSAPKKIGAEAFPDALREVLAGTDWGTRNLAGAGSAVVNAWEGLKGLVGQTDPNQVAAQKVIAEEAPIGNIAGNVAMLAPTAFIPGANTVAGAGTIGAVQGALLTPGDLKERAKAAAFGAGGGALGAGLSKAMQATKPITANPNAGILSREGIGLTPGQNAGGFLKNLEDRATSIPFAGNVIDAARRRGVEDFNRAAIRRVTQPLDDAGIPIQANGIGNDAVAALRTGLGQAYDDVLSRSSANALEPQFVQNMANLRSLAQSMPAEEARQFDNILMRELQQRMAPNGVISGQNLKDAQGAIRDRAANFAASSTAYERDLGAALKQADAEFRALIQRANPQSAADLAAINRAYANFKRVQRAASGVGADEGVFSPSQLHNAVRAMDKSKDKRAFSEGKALMQDLSSAAKAELPSKLANSGTTDRAAMSNIVTQALGLATAVPAYLAYSRPGSAAINYGMNSGLKPATESLRSLLANNPNLARLLGMSSAKLVGN